MNSDLYNDEFEENNNNIIVQEIFILKDNSFDINNYSLENKEECSRYDNIPSSDTITNPKKENENKLIGEFQEDSQSLLNQDTYVNKKIQETFITANKSEINNNSTNSNT